MESAGAVAEVVRRLDGIPLAIELAAARVAVLSVEQLTARLDDALRLLAGGGRTAPRQRTLRATLDWSYGLLDERERRLFRRLAVFAGGWTLAAAEAVMADGEPAEQGDPAVRAEREVLDALEQLLHKSLVEVTFGGAEARYRLLEPVRQYAAEQLAWGASSELYWLPRPTSPYLALPRPAQRSRCLSL